MTAIPNRQPSLAARFLAFCTSVSTFWRAVTSAVVGLAAVLVAWWLLSATFRPQAVVIAELSLPPPLLQQGYTPEVIVRRMLDDMNRLRDASNVDRADLATFEGAPGTPPPHLQSVGGISLGSVEHALRSVLGRTPLVVQGEIITKNRDQGGPLFEGRLRLGTTIISEREGKLATPDLDKLIQDLAFDLYRYFDPLRAAYAAWNLDDLEDMRIALRQLMASPRPEDRKYGLMLRANIGTPALAEADLREAIRLDPKFIHALAMLSGLERRRGAQDAAMAHAEQAIRVAPERGIGLYAKGRVQRDSGQLAEALATLQEACRREPRLATCPNQVGEVLLEMSLRADRPADLQRAAYTAFLEAARLDPTYAGALSNAAWASAAYGDLPEALLLASAAVDLAPADPVLRLRQASILRRLGADAEARQAIAEAQRLRPGVLADPPAQPWERESMRALADWSGAAGR
jgi:tetratricopeptide (TPR) repeat protein